MRDDLHGWTPHPFIAECNPDMISSIFDLVLTLILLHVTQFILVLHQFVSVFTVTSNLPDFK